MLDIKFRVANIEWNLRLNTVKFQNMINLVDKILFIFQFPRDIIF